MTVERFDKWLSENFYPAIAGLCPSLEMYKSMTPAVAKRYAELCAGKPENRFDLIRNDSEWVERVDNEDGCVIITAGGGDD